MFTSVLPDAIIYITTGRRIITHCSALLLNPNEITEKLKNQPKNVRSALEKMTSDLMVRTDV